jgi:uncharacterized protein YaeQ
MGAKYTFRFESHDGKRPLPAKILVAQDETETIAHVVLKVFAFVLFFRERLQIEGDTHNDNIPFRPDLIQLDYEMRPRLWIECGECGVNKLDKLAVKVPEAALWVVKRSRGAADHLLAAMAKNELRRNRYRLLAFDAAMFDEVCGMVGERNEIVWHGARFETGTMQFEFNGLWFDSGFEVLEF